MVLCKYINSVSTNVKSRHHNNDSLIATNSDNYLYNTELICYWLFSLIVNNTITVVYMYIHRYVCMYVD